jgi:hypothetical protein
MEGQKKESCWSVALRYLWDHHFWRIARQSDLIFKGSLCLAGAESRAIDCW